MKKFHLFYYILIFILNILNIQSLQFLKAIYLNTNSNNNYYYMITTKNLYYYNDGKTESKKSLITFEDDQIITTYEESEMISLSLFEGSFSNLLMIKHYIYAVNNGIYYCNNPIDVLKGYYPEVYALKCISGYCYFIIGIINLNKELQLFLIKNPSILCNSEVIF